MNNSAQGTRPTLTSSVSWNYIGYFAELVAGILLAAYVLRSVSLPDYGLLVLAQALAAFLYIVDFGLSNVTVQFYAEKLARGGIADVGRSASTLSIALLATGATGALLLNGIAYCVPQVVRLPSPQTGLALKLLAFVSAAVALDVAAGPIEHLCHTFYLFNRTNQLRVAMVLARVVLTILVLLQGYGVVGLAVVQCILSLLRIPLLWHAARFCIPVLSLPPFSFDSGVVRHALRMSKWAFGDDLVRRLSTNAQSIILATFASMSQVALFGVASRMPAHLYAFAARGLEVTLPTLSHSYRQNDVDCLRRAYGMAFRLCLTGVLPIAVFAAICARPLLVVWAGQQYAQASSAMVWLLASALTQALMLPSDIVLYTHGLVPSAAQFSVVESVAKVLLPLCLVFHFGAAGVAAGVAVAHVFVHLCFYLPAACRVAHLQPRSLWRDALQQRTFVNATFVAGAVVLGVCAATLRPPIVLTVFIVITSLYVVVWLSATALPFRRLHTDQLVEEVAQ